MSVTISIRRDARLGPLAVGDPLLQPLLAVVNAIGMGNPTVIEDQPVVVADVQVVPESEGFTLAGPGGMITVRRDDLFKVLEHLLLERMPDEVFWLMRPDPVFWRLSPADRLTATGLEQRHDALGGENLTLRRAWLKEAEAAGVLAAAGNAWRCRALEELDCPRVLAVAKAAQAMWDYFNSEERRTRLSEPPPRSLLGAGVSLDWMRVAQRRPSSPGWTDPAWTALCESELRTAVAGDALTGDFYLRESGEWFRVSWIREDGFTPAIRRVESV